MARLPIPGSDDGNWGEILNEFLLVEHQTDGTLIRASEIEGKYDKPSGGIPESDLSSAAQTKLNASGSAVLKTGDTMEGDLVFPATGFIMTDTSNATWRVTISTGGLIQTAVVTSSGSSSFMLGGFGGRHLISQGFGV